MLWTSVPDLHRLIVKSAKLIAKNRIVALTGLEPLPNMLRSKNRANFFIPELGGSESEDSSSRFSRQKLFPGYLPRQVLFEEDFFKRIREQEIRERWKDQICNTLPSRPIRGMWPGFDVPKEIRVDPDAVRRVLSLVDRIADAAVNNPPKEGKWSCTKYTFDHAALQQYIKASLHYNDSAAIMEVILLIAAWIVDANHFHRVPRKLCSIPSYAHPGARFRRNVLCECVLRHGSWFVWSSIFGDQRDMGLAYERYEVLKENIENVGEGYRRTISVLRVLVEDKAKKEPAAKTSSARIPPIRTIRPHPNCNPSGQGPKRAGKWASEKHSDWLSNLPCDSDGFAFDGWYV
ncbi:hypothetical protein F5Y17DRAFT_400416 [Xylariaceae sp. FL0594]|nr:hypothetical protein F5Y17DRAFT_400416 [Xylariaceae sp. FL0594]